MCDFVEKILSAESGVILLSAPTKSGKTRIVDTIKAKREGTVVISAEQFIDSIVQQLKESRSTEYSTLFAGYSCICIEDIDWYRKLEYTQLECAHIINRLAERALVIVTGIGLVKRMSPLLSGIVCYDLFEFNSSDGWICTEQKRT